MKKYASLFCFSVVILMSCGNDTNPLAKDSDSAKADPEIPHEVKNGNNSSYAFMPDSGVKSIILGNPDCMEIYYRVNGSKKVALDNGREAAVYLNSSNANKKQEMEIRVTKNEKGDEVPYAIIVQWADQEYAPKLSASPVPSSDYNFVSGHGVYIGMPYDHVMTVYKNQSLMQWEKGDTVYLEYKSKPKDANYFKRYKPESYSATYKFVDDVLRRMEYSVDPKEFEKK